MYSTRSPFEIRYAENVDCNGFDYPRRIFSHVKKNYERAEYFCCGHGVLGFLLLHSNKVKKIRFVDCFEPALESCTTTAKINNWYSRCEFSIILDDPKTNVDLFIGDPPWWPEILSGPKLDNHEIRKKFDINYETHKTMWQWLDKYLDINGDVFVTRDNTRIDVDHWNSLIPKKLEIVGEHTIKFFKTDSKFSSPHLINVNQAGVLVHLRHKLN